MFCANCGKELKKGAKFCGECGTKVEKKFKFDKKMIAFISIFVVVISLFICAKITTSPKYITNRYLKALINKNSNVLYSYLDLDDKTFIPKSLFKNYVFDNKNSPIKNYKIIDVTYGLGKLTASVKISYTTKESNSERSFVINLYKDEKKKYMFFDKWNISELNSSNVILKDYKIIVPKDTKVIYGGIKVSSKYLDKSNTMEAFDVYSLPQILMTKTDIEVTLKNGLKIYDVITPDNLFRQYKLKIKSSNLSKEDTKKIINASKDYLDLVYNSAIDNKSFDDIKSNFKAKDLADLEKSYTSFSKNLNDSKNKLKKITFDDFDILRI